MGFVNEASWDRVARVIVGVVLLVLGFGVIGGTAGTVLGAFAFIPLLTGVIGWCPLYSVFNFRTNRDSQAGSTS